MTDSPWLTADQLSERLNGIPVETLEYWRKKKTGPRYARFGRHVRYRISDVIAWEDEQLGDGAA